MADGVFLNPATGASGGPVTGTTATFSGTSTAAQYLASSNGNQTGVAFGFTAFPTTGFYTNGSADLHLTAGGNTGTQLQIFNNGTGAGFYKASNGNASAVTFAMANLAITASNSALIAQNSNTQVVMSGSTTGQTLTIPAGDAGDIFYVFNNSTVSWTVAVATGTVSGGGHAPTTNFALGAKGSCIVTNLDGTNFGIYGANGVT